MKKKNAYAIMPVGKKETMCPCRLRQNKNPGAATPGFFIPIFGNGKAYPHRLITDYLSPSNHLMM